MKKLLAALLLGLVAGGASAVEGHIRFIQLGQGSTQFGRDMAPPTLGETCAFVFTGATLMPDARPNCVPIGTGLAVDSVSGKLVTTGNPAPTINRAIITTATNGSYVWTLPVPCAVGQVPTVGITPEDGSTTTVINPKVTAKTNTTVTIQAMRTETQVVALLGLTILTVPGTAVASTLHLIALCP